MTRLLIFTLSLVALLLPGLVHAQNGFTINADEGRFYFGIAAGRAKVDDQDLFGSENVDGSVTSLGLLLDNIIAFEGGYLYFAPKREPEDDPGTPARQTGTIVRGRYLTFILRLPMDNFSIYTRLTHLEYKISVDGIEQSEKPHSAAGAGLGIDWFITNKWNLRYEVERYYDIGVTESDIVHSRIGISYYFN
ncbi:MAG: hypothetical protein OEY52_09020 [Gammaproteobacteria bacterium]|nr:hypothetical protein [Gammaproteobacteria bacterium]